ncbi:hypothetical protein PXK56_18335 [Phaeobacter gallaeciensis]|uniref:hypothetical protein n=1 Tax=Phaeobacter gallaeciensis TaxID=60890 RepID=UPI00237FF88E|nr:hypothetical protein [Phaeobacter gallaeciensis]MDE4297146.1 hypothetical protein [Phaeobacter gallaeciensis]
MTLTKTMITTRNRVARRFHYTVDPGRIDNWKVTDGDGPILDDCDGFTLTLLFNLCDRSWLKFWWTLLTFQAVIWHVTSYKGNGHAALWYRGWWADNMETGWYLTEDMRHSRRFPWLAPMVAMKLMIGKFL